MNDETRVLGVTQRQENGCYEIQSCGKSPHNLPALVAQLVKPLTANPGTLNSYPQ